MITRRAASRFQFTKSCMYSGVRHVFQGCRKMQYPKHCSYDTTVLVLRPSERDQGLLLSPMGLKSVIRQMHRHTPKTMCRFWQPKDQIHESKTSNTVMSNILLRTLIPMSSNIGLKTEAANHKTVTYGRTLTDLCIQECYTPPHACRIHVQCVFTRHMTEVNDVI